MKRPNMYNLVAYQFEVTRRMGGAARELVQSRSEILTSFVHVSGHETAKLADEFAYLGLGLLLYKIVRLWNRSYQTLRSSVA